jgi:hypothetical protein
MAGRLAAGFAALLAALVLSAVPASAAPGAVQNITGCQTSALRATDDGSSGQIALGFTAHMYDSAFSDVYINNNGNLTVDAPLSKFTPFDFRETGSPSISPFFADVDTSVEAIRARSRTARSSTAASPRSA